MLGLLASGVSGSFIAESAASLDLGRGAIAGALIVGAAFLAGYAAIRRSGLALCAFLMVAMATALQFSWLGLLPAPSTDMTIFILGLFAASAIVFLSATINAAKYNPLLGGLMFSAALVLAGMGALNFFDRIDLASFMRWGAFGVGGFGVALALTQAVRGDNGARLILPGVMLAIIAPLVGSLGAIEGGAASTLLPHGLFALGILGASLVALADGDIIETAKHVQRPDIFEGSSAFSAPEEVSYETPKDDQSQRQHRERAEIVIDSQLGRVLDYSGISIWDWSHQQIEQTDSLFDLLGITQTGGLTPDSLRSLIGDKSLAEFDSELMKPEDGPFDVTLAMKDGKMLRLRGARAALEAEQELERIVAFFELTNSDTSEHAAKTMMVENATKAAIIPTSTLAAAKKTNAAVAIFEADNITAAFQPIVSLDDMSVVGYEALARLDGQDSDNGAEVIGAAEQAGQGNALAAAMLAQAAKFVADKIKSSSDKSPAPFVAMNVSWSQMRDSAFIENVEATIKKHTLPQGALVLELTEGEAVTQASTAEPVFKKLKEAGAALAFDDFGAGFSCLGNVRKYDFDYIKIDKSFADDLDGDGDGAKIVEALAGMGTSLGLKVIVEGIESESAAKVAKKLGCAYGQGFALGRPDRGNDRKSVKQKTVTTKLPLDGSGVANDKAALAKTDKTPDDANEDDTLELTADLAATSETPAVDDAPARWRPWRR